MGKIIAMPQDPDPREVRLVVHAPLATDGWSVETLDQHVAAVRALFVQTLEG